MRTLGLHCWTSQQWHPAGMLLLIIALAGCTNNAATKSETPPANAAAANVTQDTAVSLRVMDWGEVQKIVASSRGKVVVVDIWSTSCLPCMREFPGLVALHNRHTDDVVCISFNLDYVGNGSGPSTAEQKRVLDFLTKKNATFLNGITREGSDAFYDSTKFVSIPIVLVYGRDGKLAETFKDDPKRFGKEGFSYEKHIVPTVERLLAAQK